MAGLPPSRIQANVLSEAARYEMVADRSDTAVEFGREALRVAEELGLDDIRATALITVGTARAGMGEDPSLEDIKRGIEIARRINFVTEVIRGTNNMEVRTVLAGDIPGGWQLAQDAMELAGRYGVQSFVRFLEHGAVITHTYVTGKWDALVERADALIREVEEGSPHYNAANPYGRRGLVRLARGDEAGALLDTARALELARPAGDPQVVTTVLVEAGRLYLETGDSARAVALFDEALELLRDLPDLGFTVYPLHTLAWLAWSLEREADVEQLLPKKRAQSRWLPIAEAVLAGDFHLAAQQMGDAGARAFEAFYGLQSRTESDVRAALEFYRSVGATRYVQEGEAKLAATA